MDLCDKIHPEPFDYRKAYYTIMSKVKHSLPREAIAFVAESGNRKLLDVLLQKNSKADDIRIAVIHSMGGGRPQLANDLMSRFRYSISGMSYIEVAGLAAKNGLKDLLKEMLSKSELNNSHGYIARCAARGCGEVLNCARDADRRILSCVRSGRDQMEILQDRINEMKSSQRNVE